MANSILDKVISSKHEEEITQFVPQEIVTKLLTSLPSRERDILTRRFGLQGAKQATLEEIGQTLQVTRERVRQIERGAIKRLRTNPQCASLITTVEHVIRQYLEDAGGVLSEDDLLSRMIARRDRSEDARLVLIFFLRYLCEDRFRFIPASVHIRDGWALRFFPVESIEGTIERLEKILETQKIPLDFSELMQAYREEKSDAAVNDVVLQSLLGLSTHIAQNIFQKWGLVAWPTIHPRRMKDKIYLILKQHGKPLHFQEITNQINAANFDQKVAHPPTVHNELIMDERFVLVGRGMYALAEWGYKRGIVADVVVDVLKKEGPLSREDIVSKVLEQRLVGKATVHLALMNRERFTKLPDGRYALSNS